MFAQAPDVTRRTDYFYIVAIVVLALAVTLLTPAKSSATDSTNPLLRSPTTTATTTMLTGSGTLEFWLNAEIDYSSLSQRCDYFASSWAHLTNDATGETQWSDLDQIKDNGLAGTARFKETGIRYPGGSLTLRLYSKVENGYDCSDSLAPMDVSSLTPHHVEKINIAWTKPEVLDIYPGVIVPGLTGMAVEVSPSWVDVEKPQYAGGVAMYTVTDYGTPSQVVKPITSSCYKPGSEGNLCFYQGALGDNQALGVAALPSNITPVQSTIWPPKGAISHRIGFGEIRGPNDVPEMTKGGPSESAMCNRICTGDPIDTYSGNFYETKSDLTIPGHIGIDLTRHYSIGNLGVSGAFGNGWALGYDMRVEGTHTSSTVTVIEPSGNRSAFNRASSEYSAVSPMLRADLIKTAGGWEYRRWDETITHVFDLGGKLVAVRDRNNNVVTIERSGGRVSKISEGDRFVALTWANNRLTAATDHTGRTVSYQYDGANQLASRTDPMGNAADYAYDSKNRVTTMTFEDGGAATNVYDTKNRVTQQTLPSGQTIDLQYGASEFPGKVTNIETSGDVVKTFTYLRGRIISFDDSSDPSAGFKNTYNDKGRLLASSYTEGSRKQDIFAYDAAGNLVRTEETLSGSVDHFAWDAERQLTAHTEPSGVRTESAYDERGNLVSSKIFPTDGGPSRNIVYEVSASGEPITVTNPLGGVSSLEYSTAGDLVSTTDPVGGRTSYENDTLGRTTKTVSPGGNVNGATQDDAAKFTETFVYDANGNVTETNNQSGTTSYQYDALNRPVAITDPRGKAKSVAYEPAGKPVKITHPDGSVDSFTYNVDTGERTSWTDPQQNTTTYNQSGGTSTTISPDGTTTSVRQAIGQLGVTTSLIDAENPEGVIVREGSPLDTFLYPKGSASGESASHSARNSAGQVTRDISEGLDVSYEYNGFGELSSQSGADRNVSYSYDAAGNITGITYPDGTSVSREMDPAGRIAKITDWTGTEYSFSYNADGKISGATSSTGLSYSQEHDGNKPTSKVWKDSVGAVLASFENSYEESGLLASDTKETAGGSSSARSFDWTDNGALAAVDSDPVTWDGRLLTNTGRRALGYDTATSRVTESSSSQGPNLSYSYDSKGNRTSVTDGTATSNYSWDLLNRLSAIDEVTFTYGNDDIRTKVNSNAQVYDQGLKLLSDGNTKYLWSPDGTLLAQAALDGAGSTTIPSQAITDAMGSVYSVVSQSGSTFQALAEYSYSPFGERTLVSGTDVSAMGFVSEQHDESGLIYLRFRYYDPQIGLFISVDPLVTSTLDPYGYASGNPLQMIDPLGLFSWRSSETWSNIGLGLAVVGAVAAVATVTVATGGVALPVLTAIAFGTSGLSTGITAYQTGRECLTSGVTQACGWGMAGTALGAIPFAKPVSYLGKFAGARTPKHLSTVEQLAWNARNTNAKVAFGAINGAGVPFEMVNRYCN